jgi:hypothetical protein
LSLQNQQVRRRRLSQNNACILSKQVKQLDTHAHSEKWQCELLGSDATSSGRAFVDLEGLEDLELESLESGVNTLYSEFAVISNGKLKIPKGAAKSIQKTEQRGPAAKGKSKGGPKNGRSLAPVDARKVLVARIQANDSTTSFSKADLGNYIFGANGDPVNLKERFEECSFGAMTMEPFEGTTNTNQAITGGVVDIVVDIDVSGKDDEIVKDETVLALTDQFGDLPSQFDHVMLCIPPGTAGGWIGYGKRIK